MLRAATWTVRGAVLIAVGIITFTTHWPAAAHGSVKMAAFAAAASVMILWALADLSATTRDRYAFLLPYALGVIAVACNVAGGPLTALSLIAAIAAGSGTSLAAGWVVVGLGILAAESAGLAGGGSAWVTVVQPAVLLVGLLLGLNRRGYRIQAEQSAALLARADQLREERAQVATLEERTRIAREIHDVLAHSLGALGVHIQLIRAVLTDQNDTPQAADLLSQAHRMASDGLAETRRAVHALRGQTPPLPEGLAELSAEHQRRNGAPVSFEVTGAPRPLPADAGLALTRTAQEALVNAAKHAPLQPVEVRLDYTDASTSLVVTSQLGEHDQDGHGEGLATVNGGYGLAGMRERLLLLDGTLTAGRSGSGWVVAARVPR